MSETLIDKVMEAKTAAEAGFADQVAKGISLDPRQQAQILIAQVQAIISGEVIEPAPEPKA